MKKENKNESLDKAARAWTNIPIMSGHLFHLRISTLDFVNIVAKYKFDNNDTVV